jgi:transcriptional regulator with XRE-family HTH domain
VIAMATLGETIRKARERKKLSVLELALQIGVAQSTVSRLENDEYATAPKPEIVKNLSKALDVPEWKLVRDAGYPVGPAEPKVAPSSDDRVEELAAELRDSRLTDQEMNILRGLLDSMVKARPARMVGLAPEHP